MKGNVGVLIHGFYLHVPDWESVVWGSPPSLLGRLPRGILVASEEDAQAVTFATGASEKDGKKEGQFTYDYLMERFLDLASFPDFASIDLDNLRKRIEEVSIIEATSRSTIEEVIRVGTIFKGLGINTVFLVSNDTHIERCIRDWRAVWGNTFRLCSEVSDVNPGKKSPRDVVIFEPPHRPDKPLQNIALRLLTNFFKRLYRFPKTS